VLVNYFSSRVARYGKISGDRQSPNRMERGRATLDLKVRRSVLRGLTLTIAGTNLTDAPVTFYHEIPGGGRATAGSYKLGVGLSLGLGYEF
jgi:hypothetical protein